MGLCQHSSLPYLLEVFKCYSSTYRGVTILHKTETVSLLLCRVIFQKTQILSKTQHVLKYMTRVLGSGKESTNFVWVFKQREGGVLASAPLEKRGLEAPELGQTCSPQGSHLPLSQPERGRKSLGRGSLTDPGDEWRGDRVRCRTVWAGCCRCSKAFYTGL